MSFESVKAKYSVIHSQMCTSFILDICKQFHMLRISICFMIYIYYERLFVCCVCLFVTFRFSGPGHLLLHSSHPVCVCVCVCVSFNYTI